MPVTSDGGRPDSAVARARYLRIAPMKTRRVVDMVRGLPVAEAQAILAFAPQAAAEPVGKVVASAVANAQNNFSLDPRTLYISEAFVDEGPTMNRFRPRAQGRAYRIRKRTSHVTVVVTSRPAAAAVSGRVASSSAAGGKRTSNQKGRTR